jgi:TldD protein
VLRALDAARTAGAHYADARLTRSVGHEYKWQSGSHLFSAETEVQGIGVRALVDRYWGFAAAAVYDVDAVVRLAQDAVAQAKTNAAISHAGTATNPPGGLGQTVELAPAPAVTGTWATPVVIDPFTVPVEEKLDFIATWDRLAMQHGLFFPTIYNSALVFTREERVLGTTEGTLVVQTIYQTGGGASLQSQTGRQGSVLTKLDMAGRGWELILDAKIPEQIAAIAAAPPRQSDKAKSAQVGRYTLVCDGATMAVLLDSTLGMETQLDRALGYEANASGTSYLNDPLAMLGTFQAASSLVTVTANRSAPIQLATVKWDAEGVVPEDVTLIKNGVLTDYQTTREQASWLAPYYQKVGKPVRSHGHAAAETALLTPLQMSPNLGLAPSSGTTRLEDLTASVPNGFLIAGGSITTDYQARTGTLRVPAGGMREIRNGRVGEVILGGAVQFDSPDLWKKVTALGNVSTVASLSHGSFGFMYGGVGSGITKGEPAQSTSYTVQAPAALIEGQAVIDTARIGR